jgi:hypothetical protein
MIKYNDNTINKWYHDGELIKVYYHGAVVFYKFDSEQGGYKVCFAVVDDITQYSETEFEDVYDNATEKWYKLNNLSQYEEYGVYGSGRSVTTYNGKLTIDDGYEYEWNGSSWVNLGEVSGSTATLPDVPFTLNYNAKDYDASTHVITKTSGQLNDIDAVITGTTSNISDYSSDGYIRLTGSSSTPLRARVSNSSVNGYFNRSNTNPNLTVIAKILTQNSNTADDVLVNRDSRNYNWMYRHKPSLVTLHGSSEQGSIAVSNTVPNICSARVASNRLLTYNNWTQNTTSTYSNFNYGGTTSDGGALFCSYATYNSYFWKGDFYWIYMSQNTLTDEQVQQVIDYNEEGGGEPEYPKYYSEKSEPLDNLTFNTLAEAQAYAEANCVYVGLKATIDGDKYVFSGDSQSGYEWVYNPSRLPVGYTEVEYIENESVAYINTSFKPNQDTRVIARMQTVTSMMHARFFGAGVWNGSNGYQFDYENYYNGQLHISWGAINGWSTYNYYGDYNAHTYDWNKNVFTIDNGVFSAETTYTSFQCTDNLGLFVHIYNGEPCGDVTPWLEGYERSFLHGRLYSCQIYDNGTLIRDLVPCTRDSDSKVGVYDIVNDVFYSSAYSGYEFTAGDPV